MKKIIISILTLIMFCGCFAGVSAPANTALAQTEQVATAEADTGYYIQANLKDTGRHLFYGLYGAGSGFLDLPIRTKWFKPTDNLVTCDIEIQFYFDNEADNFVLVVPSQISARTYLYNANIIEFSFIDNYEFVLSAKQYNLLQAKPYYQIVLRDGHVHYKVQCDDNFAHGELVYTYISAGLPGSQQVKNRYVKYFEPTTYGTTTYATTSNPIEPKGEIIEPIDPGGTYPIVKPEEPVSFWNTAFNWIQSGITGNDTTKKILAWVVVVLCVMCVITVISFVFKWFKFVFGG